MNFEEIQKKATAEWEALEKGDKPHIIVGAATCGRAAGALAVIDAINDALAKHNIEATITHVGCIGICYIEPLVDIVKPNRPRICYGNVTPEIATQLIEDYIVNDNVRPDLALGSIGDGDIEGIPKFWDLPMLKPQKKVG